MEDKRPNRKDEALGLLSAHERWENLWNALSEEELAGDVSHAEAEHLKDKLLRRLAKDFRAQLTLSEISGVVEFEQASPADDTANGDTAYYHYCPKCQDITTHILTASTVEEHTAQIRRYVRCESCHMQSYILEDKRPDDEPPVSV
ncbi:MAG: hypothetical protein ABSD98_05055 [Candidatus Korobacteraceae bacterium]|jgi:hypothetical protein